MELIVILVLIIFNGLLSMTEIAIVAAKKSILQEKQSTGDKSAERVLKLVQNPNRLFSTIQVGITLIGVFTGAVGALTFSEPIATFFFDIGLPIGMSRTIALALVVIVTTYLSIVVGELVPKRLGLSYPEKVSLWMSGPMDVLSKIFAPIVRILSDSTEFLLRFLGIKSVKETPVSADELRFMLRQGAQMGIFKTTEKNIVEKTLNLRDANVTTVMTPRSKMVWIDIDSDFEALKTAVLANQYSYYPVCRDTIDHVEGIINSDALLAAFIAGEKIRMKELMYQPLLIPENMKALQVMELFKRKHIHMGIVIDEYGAVQGLVTVTDILEAIVGDMPEIHDKEEKQIIRRDKNTWYLDGLLSTADYKEYFKGATLPDEKEGGFNTIGGFVMHKLGKVPTSGDRFTLGQYRFEVVDMDGNRVDKVMLVRLTP